MEAVFNTRMCNLSAHFTTLIQLPLWRVTMKTQGNQLSLLETKIVSGSSANPDVSSRYEMESNALVNRVISRSQSIPLSTFEDNSWFYFIR